MPTELYPSMYSTSALTPLGPDAYSDKNLPQLTANITRSQWEDYKARFMPFEDAVMDQTVYNNPGIVSQEIGRALPGVDSAIDISQGTQQRRLAAMGQRLSYGQQAGLDSFWDQQKALSRADAANQIRLNIAARSRDIAFGGGTKGAITATTGAGA